MLDTKIQSSYYPHTFKSLHKVINSMASRTKPLFGTADLPDAARADFIKKLADWRAKASAANMAIEQERAARALLIPWFTDKAKEGTNIILVGTKGNNLVMQKKVNRDVDPDQLEAALSQFNAAMENLRHLFATGEIDQATYDVRAAEIEKTMVTQKHVDDLVKFKPSLITGAWKEAEPAVRLLFADIVTEKPGSPSLEFKETAT